MTVPVKIIISFLCNDKISDMKKIVFFLLTVSPIFAVAQNKIFAEGTSSGMYVNHKVIAKENYYSIGRIYNVSPKEIAPFNKLKMETGLNPGQVLKIPIATNFFQAGDAAADETFVPVYYAVKEKEGLFRVANDHNDLPLETLKRWNGLKGDALSKGAVLIVGYLKVKKELSLLAASGIGSSITASNASAVAIKTKSDKETPIETDKSLETAIKSAKENVAPLKPAADEPVVKKVEKTEQVKAPAAPVKTQNTKNIKGSDFKMLYETQAGNGEAVAEEGLAGIFKSTSGWTDGKYYCLHNSAATGSVVKISNPANGKMVYAKVLDLIPDIKQNNGMAIVISNAAAQELGATENNFSCVLNYLK